MLHTGVISSTEISRDLCYKLGTLQVKYLSEKCQGIMLQTEVIYSTEILRDLSYKLVILQVKYLVQKYQGIYKLGIQQVKYLPQKYRGIYITDFGNISQRNIKEFVLQTGDAKG